MATDYVYKETSSNVCTVEDETARPHHGSIHLGPFHNKTEATSAMCADIDPTMADPSRCWLTRPPNACQRSAEEPTE